MRGSALLLRLLPLAAWSWRAREQEEPGSRSGFRRASRSCTRPIASRLRAPSDRLTTATPSSTERRTLTSCSTSAARLTRSPSPGVEETRLRMSTLEQVGKRRGHPRCLQLFIINRVRGTARGTSLSSARQSPGAGFYPRHDEGRRALAGRPPMTKRVQSLFTVIRRDGTGWSRSRTRSTTNGK